MKCGGVRGWSPPSEQALEQAWQPAFSLLLKFDITHNFDEMWRCQGLEPPVGTGVGTGVATGVFIVIEI